VHYHNVKFGPFPPPPVRFIVILLVLVMELNFPLHFHDNGLNILSGHVHGLENVFAVLVYEGLLPLQELQRNDTGVYACGCMDFDSCEWFDAAMLGC